jgi:hypothetical protein
MDWGIGMELKEAYEKASDDDKLTILKAGEAWYSIRKSDMHDIEIVFEYAISDQWKIIPAKPKVLTAEECLHEYSGRIEAADYIAGFEDGKPQGRLERDLELRPVFEAVEEYEEKLGEYESRNAILEAYANIPPLNKK